MKSLKLFFLVDVLRKRNGKMNGKDKETKTINGVKCTISYEVVNLTSKKIDTFNRLLAEKAVEKTKSQFNKNWQGGKDGKHNGIY